VSPKRAGEKRRALRYYFSACWVKKAVVSLRFPRVVSHVLEQEGSGTGHGCSVFTRFPNIFRGLGVALHCRWSGADSPITRTGRCKMLVSFVVAHMDGGAGTMSMLSTFHFICYCMYTGDSSEVSPQHYNSTGSRFQQDSCPLVLLLLL
jgi:hypothetical protein